MTTKSIIMHVRSVKKKTNKTINEETKKKNTPTNSNSNYRREMRLILINIYFCLPQFNALKIFLGFRLNGGPYLTLIFSM